MRLTIIIACIFLAANVHAQQSSDSVGSKAKQEAPPAPVSAPSWASADADPASSDYNSTEPSYSDVDEPSFGDDRDE